MTDDERLVADELARLHAIEQQPGEDHWAAAAAYLQRVILSRMTAVEAAKILRHMAIEAIEHFGDRRPERNATGVGNWVAGQVIAAHERTWMGTPFRLRRHAAQAGAHVPGEPYFWNEGHFAYLGRRFLARRTATD